MSKTPTRPALRNARFTRPGLLDDPKEMERLHPNGLIGRACSRWLANRLMGRGDLRVLGGAEPFSEDWGWLVAIESEGVRSYAGLALDPDGDQLSQWALQMVFDGAFLPWGRARRYHGWLMACQAVNGAIASDPDVTGLAWSSPDQDARPKRGLNRQSLHSA